MKSRGFTNSAARLFAVTAVLFFTAALQDVSCAASKKESAFRRDFESAYDSYKFDYLAALIRNNKAIVPSEIRAIIKEASSEDMPFEEKMHLLDIANAMASMYKHWHGDGRPLLEVEAVQRRLIGEENERLAEIEKWKRFERYTGNILYRGKLPELEAKGVKPVIFPHWVHRLWYGCKACHEGVFISRRASNTMSHADFLKGNLCGTCHDGKTAFGINSECERCHSAGGEAGERVNEPSKTDIKKIKETADRIGSVFKPEGLKDGKLPVDKFGFIDWAALSSTGGYAPLKSLDKGGKDTARDNAIVFEPSMPNIKFVSFSHTTHSRDLDCSTCHTSLFKDALGANKFTMAEMAEGTYCGHCHGKVSFKFADCNRCHRLRPDEKPEEQRVLTRKAKPSTSPR